MVALDRSTSTRRSRVAVIAAILLLFAELAAIGVIFKHSISFNCLDNWPQPACAGASRAMVSLYCAGAALILMAMLIPQPFRTLKARAGDRLWPLALNLSGVAVALLPVTFMRDGAGVSVLLPAFACWAVGMLLILSGLALFIAPLPRWRDFFQNTWHHLIPVLAAGLAAPWLATKIRPLWRLDVISDATFEAVAWMISSVGYDIVTVPEKKIIGSDQFSISVAPQCSGIEGIALVTLFVTLYLWLFRQELRFPRAFLLYPIGILASALFNVVRIAALLMIGLEGNVGLAVGGFHSHAGWLMFTVVALGLIALARTVPGLQKPGIGGAPASAGATAGTQSAAAPPLWQDPVAARILPFAVFMLSALIGSSFIENPGQFYPVRALMVGLSLALFYPIYRRLVWAPGALSITVGIAIGVMWILIPYSADGPPPYGDFVGVMLVVWFLCRGIGTIVFVPLLEELFFRDYLVSKLKFGSGQLWYGVAVLVSAILFAGLHGRWAEAFVAALAFSYVYHRTGRITDSVIAHAVANLIVFATALITGQMHII